MQNRYVGDIGDYLKLGILRVLSRGHRLGIAWWLFPDEHHNQAGEHVRYLARPDQWRRFDPELFDTLHQIVSSGERYVRALETASILPEAIFANEVIPTGDSVADRRKQRERWFQRVERSLEGTDLVFVDPDNGLEPDGYQRGAAKAGKSVTIAALQELARPGRCLIVYHHQTRRKGGHLVEIAYWADRLRQAGLEKVDALRAKPYSPRVYFLLNAPDDIRRRAARLAKRWDMLITWHPDLTVKSEIETSGNGTSDEVYTL